MRTWSVIALLPLCASLALAEPAPAPAPAPADPAREAKRLFDEGTKSYNLGEYDDAIALWKQGYRLLDKPIFLYNIGQGYRLSGNLRQAVIFYKSYVNAAPTAKDRAEVDARIAELEAAIKREDEAKNAAPTGPGPAEPPPERPKIVAPDKVVERAPPVLPAPPPAAGESRARPIYKKWWFWTGVVGVVALGAAVTVIALRDDGAGTPSSDLGNFPVF